MIHDLIIIGAGIAAAAALDELRGQDWCVLTLEKSRGWGGRMATRRNGELAFDHGAQFFTAQSDAFQTIVEREFRTVERWHVSETKTRQHFVGSPSMKSLVAALGQGTDPLFSTRVQTCDFNADEDVWIVQADGDSFLSRRLLVTAPAPQTAALLPPGEVRERAARVEYSPCWALMVAFDEPLDIAPTHRNPTPEIGWAAHNGSKPGRFGQTWVIHGSEEWSEENLEREPDAIATELLQSFKTHFDVEQTHTALSAHRWRYALVRNPLNQACVAEPEVRLVGAGDWCLGPRVESAFLSGRAAAKKLKEWT